MYSTCYRALITFILLLTVGCTSPTSPTDECIVNGITLHSTKVHEWTVINGRDTLITVWQPATTIKLCD